MLAVILATAAQVRMVSVTHVAAHVNTTRTKTHTLGSATQQPRTAPSHTIIPAHVDSHVAYSQTYPHRDGVTSSEHTSRWNLTMDEG